MSSADLFGFDDSDFLNETLSDQDHPFFQTWQDFQDGQLNNNEIPSLSELGDADYSVFQLKNEEYCRLSFGRFPTFSCSDETAANNYYQKKQTVSLKPHFDCLPASSRNRLFPSPESSSFSSGDIRRFCSSGDMHKEKTSMQVSSANLKVERYSVEEKKVRIDRYRAKRARRNFNKTITYACRKTLADGRRRVRGRFVRNDEVGEILRASLFQRCEDEDYFWV